MFIFKHAHLIALCTAAVTVRSDREGERTPFIFPFDAFLMFKLIQNYCFFLKFNTVTYTVRWFKSQYSNVYAVQLISN